MTFWDLDWTKIFSIESTFNQYNSTSISELALWAGSSRYRGFHLVIVVYIKVLPNALKADSYNPRFYHQSILSCKLLFNHILQILIWRRSHFQSTSYLCLMSCMYIFKFPRHVAIKHLKTLHCIYLASNLIAISIIIKLFYTLIHGAWMSAIGITLLPHGKWDHISISIPIKLSFHRVFECNSI